MAQLLGPSNPVAPEQAVAIQCIMHSDCPVSHPCFTNDNVHTETGEPLLIVFSDATLITEATRFVGVVASRPTYFGAFGHIAVYVRGAVTVACDTEPLRHALPMTWIAFRAPDPSRAAVRFIGLPSLSPPAIVPASVRRETRIVGLMLQKGRAPSCEARVLLMGGKERSQTFEATVRDMADKDPQEVAYELTLGELAHLLGDAECATELSALFGERFQTLDGTLNVEAVLEALPDQ